MAALLPRIRFLVAFVTVAALAGAIGLSATAAIASGRTYRVTSASDSHDAHPGDGRCADSTERCTLRAAIEEADAAIAGSAVTIVVPSGRYLLSLGTLSISPVSGKPLGLTIQGAGPATTSVDANHSFRVLDVSAPASVSLTGLSIINGVAGPTGYGGGIYSSAVLTVFDSWIVGNKAAAGGGLANAGGSLVITASLVASNDGGVFGGGGVQNGGPSNLGGDVRIVSSTIRDNVTTNEGGGVFNGQNGHPAAAPGTKATAAMPVCLTAPVCHPAHLSDAPTAAPLTVTIVDSRIIDNTGTNGGGGVANNGNSVIIAGSRIDGNSAAGAVGGGVFDVNLVTNSTLSRNVASSGGAVENFPSASTTIKESLISGNRVAGHGGGVEANGTVNIVRSTLADNVAGGPFVGNGSAIILNGGAQLNLTNSTVSRNTTIPSGGGVLYNFDGKATLAYDTFSNDSVAFVGGYTSLTATIVASDGGGPNCAGPVHETSGFNLDSGTSCDFSLPTDISGVNPRLGPLEDNGGPTPTEVLLSESPAIDRGGLPATAGCPTVDQRGRTRPWGPACDIGAYEKHYELTGG